MSSRNSSNSSLGLASALIDGSEIHLQEESNIISFASSPIKSNLGPKKTLSWMKSPFILPISIRSHIYSYMPLKSLLDQIGCLCKKDREFITSDSELLSQDRCLRISLSPTCAIDYNQLKYCMNVATSYELYIEKMQEIEVMPLEMILHKITKINKSLTRKGKN